MTVPNTLRPFYRHCATSLLGLAVCGSLSGPALAQTILVERHTAPLRVPTGTQAQAPAAQAVHTVQSLQMAQVVQVATAGMVAMGPPAWHGTGLVVRQGQAPLLNVSAVPEATPALPAADDGAISYAALALGALAALVLVARRRLPR